MDPLATAGALANEWEREAQTLRRRGLEREAQMAESYAADLRERFEAWGLEALDLSEAAAEAGLAYDTVQRKVASGELPNVGKKGRPRVRRADLHPWIEAPVPSELRDPVAELADETLAGREVRQWRP